MTWHIEFSYYMNDNILYLNKVLGQPSRGGLEVERSLHKRRDSALVGSNPV